MLQIRKVHSDKKYVYERISLLFSIIVLCATFSGGIACFITKWEMVNSYFVTDHADTGMDYFNMLSNVTQDNPYYAYSNYPALNFVIFRIIFHFFSFWIKGQLNDGFFLRKDMTAQLTYIILMFVCVLTIWEMLKKFSGNKGIESSMFAAAMIFSGPMLFLYERGNILIITLVLMLLFLMMYDSNSRMVRIISYVCLAFASAMKLYPAAFGLLVLKKKRYRETMILVAMGCCFF